MTITEKTVDVTMASCTLERYLTECNPRTTHSDVPNKPQSPILPTEDSHIRRQLGTWKPKTNTFRGKQPPGKQLESQNGVKFHGALT